MKLSRLGFVFAILFFNVSVAPPLLHFSTSLADLLYRMVANQRCVCLEFVDLSSLMYASALTILPNFSVRKVSVMPLLIPELDQFCKSPLLTD